ncbi:MAG: amino acid permease [Proteobacteria bacterium]|nr:MAG: amino acid permease [Pseudomonadota bacterium]
MLSLGYGHFFVSSLRLHATLMHMATNELRRDLRLPEALGIVIGTIIGTGIFLKTSTMTQLVGSSWWVLAAWAVAGGMSLVGALVYAELGELFPQAGGEYVYLRSGYGSWLGFLYGWQRFWIGSPASIAAYGVGAATFMRGVWPISASAATLLAVALIAAFSALNCLAVQVGGRAQALLTALKLILVLGLTGGLLFFSSTGSWDHFSGAVGGTGAVTFGWSGFGLAVLSALWAFDGWNNLPMAAGEVKDPSRTVPTALIVGVLAVFAAYALANIAFFYALPAEQIIMANSAKFPDALPVATMAAQTVVGHLAVGALAIAMVISALGAMNGSILTGARVPFAMARDGIFPKKLGEISGGGQVPVPAVIAQGVWSCVLALSGTFDQLTDLVVFSGWIFYGLCGFSVLLFRKKLKDRERRYKVPLYPALPLLFCLSAVLLLANTVVASPADSAKGLVLILLGLPVYWWMRRGKAKGIAAAKH